MVVSERIARAFNRSGASQSATQSAALKTFDRVWHVGHKLINLPKLTSQIKSYGFSGQIFGLISSFLSNKLLWVVVDGKSSKEYPVNAGVP